LLAGVCLCYTGMYTLSHRSQGTLLHTDSTSLEDYKYSYTGLCTRMGIVLLEVPFLYVINIPIFKIRRENFSIMYLSVMVRYARDGPPYAWFLFWMHLYVTDEITSELFRF
jgi:hypothetical protein